MHFKGYPAHIKYILNSDINEMYVMIMVRSFFTGMISTFLPIYLYSKGIAIIDIAMFYIIKALVGIPLLIAIQWALKRISFTKAFFISGLAYITMLYLLKVDAALLPLIAIISEFSEDSYWIPFHYLFAHLTNKKNEKKNFGLSRAIMSFAPTLSPIVGATIILNEGYLALFIISSIGILISIIPILFIKKHIKIKRPFKNIFKLSARYFAEGVRSDSLMVYWPILIFLILGIERLGIVSSIASILGGISLLLIGQYIANPKKYMDIGGKLHSITIFIRTIVNDLLSVMTINIVGYITNGIMITPYLMEFYDKFRERDYHLLTREINIRYGRIIVGILLILFIGMELHPLRMLMVIAIPTSYIMSKMRV